MVELYWKVAIGYNPRYGASVSPTDPSADCVQFAPPTEHDSPTYAKLWAVTSADGAPNGLKPTLKKYVQH